MTSGLSPLAQPKNQHRPWPVALRLVVGLSMLVAIGAGLLMLPAASAKQPLPFSDALFTATSALTVTGLTVRTTSIDFSLTGRLILLGWGYTKSFCPNMRRAYTWGGG
jgi:trk system potassium uptake protein